MIRLYEDKDLKELINIAKILWGEELEFSDELKEFIYTLLIKYYLYKNNLTYVLDEEEIKGFALASIKDEFNNHLEWFNSEVIKLNEEDQIKAIKYLEYLDYNENKVNKYITNNDVHFNLLTSIRHHAGRELIDNLINISKNKGYKKIYFWTDETCNYHYYEQSGFIKLETYTSNLLGKEILTFIYMIEL